ncbi:MAG: hypothetical protein H0V70_11590 [Ktedonobacteraceae bacterium]|nr:hypothetical protein [Ktedonobacteraceae bacterium]
MRKKTISTSQKTLFITGVSSGFGRAFAVEALRAGHHAPFEEDVTRWKDLTRSTDFPDNQ